MCDVATRIQKLCQIAGQAEYDLVQTIAYYHHWSQHGYNYARYLTDAREILVLRGDAWAITTFDRILAYVKENPDKAEFMANLKRQAETRDQAIQQAMAMGVPIPEELVCHEVADLVRGLEAVEQ